MSTGVDPLVARVRPERSGSTASITVRGQLDANIGVELLAAVQAELDAGSSRLDIDLLQLEGWTPEGARALRRARSLARGLSDGLHFRTGPGAGHDAVLEAFADEDE